LLKQTHYEQLTWLGLFPWWHKCNLWMGRQAYLYLHIL